MQKYILIICSILILLSYKLNAEKYSVFEIDNPSDVIIPLLNTFGVQPNDILHNGSTLKFVANSNIVEYLNKYEFRIAIDDYSAFIEKRNDDYKSYNSNKIQSSEFKFGSMGGFFTFSELIAEYDSLLNEFPEIIEKEIIGQSCENRDIYLYKIGNFKTASPLPMPQVLLTSLHHSREPASGMVLLYFIKDILAKYKQNDHIADYLINTRNIYVVPVVNPDGYCYNELNYPNGGGLWRKNRRKVNDSAYGIDINRNYGPFEFWNSSVGGSSDNPRLDNYRGTSPFSEPETQTIKELCEQNNFKIAVNYHSYGDLLVYPWGVLLRDTPDSSFFRRFSYYSTHYNKFVYGLDLQTLNYTARGNSDDWMYLETDAKNKIYSFTAEIGNLLDNFWCPIDRIEQLCKDNLAMNYEFLFAAAGNCRVINHEVVSNAGTQLKLELANIGTSKAENVVLTISSLTENVVLEQNIYNDISLNSGEAIYLSPNIYTSNGFNNGSMASFQIEIQENGLSRKDTIFRRIFNNSSISLFDGTMNKWEPSEWGTEFDGSIEKNVLSCSPSRDYANYSDNYITLIKGVDLNDASKAELTFRSKLFIENTWDAAVVEISTNSGLSWTNVKTDRMIKGLGITYSRQEKDNYYLQGNYFEYFNQTIDLSQFSGKNIKIRFGLLSDGGGTYDGWKISDVYIKTPGMQTKVDEYNSDKLINRFSLAQGNNFVFDKGEANISNYYLCDLEGKILMSNKVLSNTIEMQTSNLSKGVYFIMLFGENALNKQVILLIE